MPADYGRGLDDERPGFPVPPSGREPGPKESIRWRQFRALHRALQNADLVTQRENLQLECSAAPKQPESEAMSAVIKGPNGSRTMSDTAHFINAIAVYENRSTQFQMALPLPMTGTSRR